MKDKELIEKIDKLELDTHYRCEVDNLINCASCQIKFDKAKLLRAELKGRQAERERITNLVIKRYAWESKELKQEFEKNGK